MKSDSRPNVLQGLVAVALCALAFSLPSRSEPVEGRDYERLAAPQAPESAGKIEVLEFFSYGCPHCNTFHPLVSQWSAQLPGNVNFIRVPVSMGHAQWGQLVRAYYALQATGNLARLDTALFDAIHKEKQPLFNEASITAWAVQHGVDAAKFTAAYNSFDVSARSSRAEQLSRNYQVDGIPRIVVDGKYVPLGSSFDQVLVNATQLIGKSASNAR